MAAVAESAAILSEQAKKEEKNRKREAKNRALEEEKRRKKEEEERKKWERELQAIANFRNNGQNNKQAPRMPVNPAAALAKPQPLAPKAPVKAAQTPLPVVAPAKTTVPTSTAHVTSVNPAPVAWGKVVPNNTINASKTSISQQSQTQSVAPAKATVPSLPIASGKSLNDASNINQYQQQPAAHATCSTEVTFFVGQISINPSEIMKTPKANILFGRKETQATTVLKTHSPAVETQATTVVEKTQTTAETQKTQGTNNVAAATYVSVSTSVTTILPGAVAPQTNRHPKAVAPQTNQPPKAVVPQANQPAKEKAIPATKTTNGQIGPVNPYYSGTRKYNGPVQKINGNGRVPNGGNGSGQNYNHYNGNVNGYGQRYNGNGYDHRYNGNGRFTNVNRENQKKQAKPEPIFAEDGFQLVVNRRR